ncbi:MAG: YgiQ family radical SAM protein, partial [Planctomycetes bacterium]|nr:YgiQ family radical SAM protein [Planctomycetota bacterium]
RLAHYDYWSDTVRPSMLVSSKAELLVYGMGEQPILEIAERLRHGEPIEACRDMRGVCYLLGAKSEPPDDAVRLPSFEEVASDKVKFAIATRHIHHETNPLNARRIVQAHGAQHVVQNPPQLPLAEGEMDAIYDLAYSRRPHPAYAEPVPAHAMIKDSVTIMRGCFGGCTFCSITAHQGRIIQSRSKASVVREVRELAEAPDFKGTVSDIGGPTANMYQMRCTKPEVEAVCRRLSCVHPTICKLLGTDHGPLVELMRETREQPGVKRVLVSSGVRMDLAQKSRVYLDELAKHHVGGHLKVAPEHASDRVLERMKKPSIDDFVEFGRKFQEASKRAGKEQYLVPYFIASHPGSELEDMIELALFLKRNGYKPRQAQDFIPAPLDVATCMYWTGLDPMTMKPVPVVKSLRDRKAQRALMQFWKPEHWFVVRDALIAAGRKDLIGAGCDALIPAQPPKEAIDARRKAANEAGMIHEIPTPRQAGYRPHRPSTARPERPRRR